MGAFAAMPTAGAVVHAPPSAAAEASVAERTPPAVSVGPGAFAVTVIRLGYTFRIEVNPNRVAAASSVALELTRNGRRVRTASVRLSLAMLDMQQMPQQLYELTETRPGIYTRKLVVPMAGPWRLTFTVRADGSPPLTAQLVDHVEG